MSEENGYVNDMGTTGTEPTVDAVGPDGVAADVASGTADRQVADERERYLRLAAEYDNFRKRTTKERQEAHLRGQGDMLRGMIDALDDLARFAHVDPATTDAKTIADGVAMVEKKLMKTLAGHGLEVIDPVGQPFDPARHEAVMTEPATSPDEDHLVARVFQQGYLFNGQLLRPARVVVKQWNG
jgi:molecular chaperone GrpE